MQVWRSCNEEFGSISERIWRADPETTSSFSRVVPRVFMHACMHVSICFEARHSKIVSRFVKQKLQGRFQRPAARASGTCVRCASGTLRCLGMMFGGSSAFST